MPLSDATPYSESYGTFQEAQALSALKKDMMAQLRAVNKRIAELEDAGPVPSSTATAEQVNCSPDKKGRIKETSTTIDKAVFCIEFGERYRDE